MKGHTHLIMLILLLPAVAGLAGCPFSPEKDDGDNPPPPLKFKARTSPENLLHNLKEAYTERSLVDLDSILDQKFTFFFSEEDQQIAERLVWQEEHDIHELMFDADIVHQLRLDFEYGEIEVDPEKSTEADTLWTTLLTKVDLYVFGIDPQHPEADPQGWEMKDGLEQFWFHRKPWKDPETGEPIWTIIEWQELTNSGGG